MKAVHHSLETGCKPNVASTCLKRDAAGTESHISVCYLGRLLGNQKCRWIHPYFFLFSFLTSKLLSLHVIIAMIIREWLGVGVWRPFRRIANCFRSQSEKQFISPVTTCTHLPVCRDTFGKLGCLATLLVSAIVVECCQRRER